MNDPVDQALLDALEQCIRWLHEGKSVSECLKQYPSLARELGPLLEVGAVVQRSQVRSRELLAARERVRARLIAANSAAPKSTLRLRLAAALLVAIFAGVLLWQSPAVLQFLSGSQKTPTPSHTPSLAATSTPSASPTATVVPTTVTATVTASGTPTASSTATLTSTATDTATDTATVTVTVTVTARRPVATRTPARPVGPTTVPAQPTSAPSPAIVQTSPPPPPTAIPPTAIPPTAVPPTAEILPTQQETDDHHGGQEPTKTESSDGHHGPGG